MSGLRRRSDDVVAVVEKKHANGLGRVEQKTTEARVEDDIVCYNVNGRLFGASTVLGK